MFSLLNPKRLKSSNGKYNIMNKPILIFIEGKIFTKANTIIAQITLRMAVE